MAKANAQQKNLYGEGQITTEYMDNNKVVRKMMIDRSIVPENLPTAENIKKVERWLLSASSEEKKTLGNKNNKEIIIFYIATHLIPTCFLTVSSAQNANCKLKTKWFMASSGALQKSDTALSSPNGTLTNSYQDPRTHLSVYQKVIDSCSYSAIRSPLMMLIINSL